MLRIIVSESAQAARNYFGQSLSRGDYYLEGVEVAGSWGGRGAKRLGLSGKIDRESFLNLLENRRPDGEQLTARMNEKRRPGYDFTFDVPKSVSILHLLSGDERIAEAMRRAIAVTMAEMEDEMHARVRKDGAFTDRKTGNMIWADFVHLTSRPALLPLEVEKQFLATNPWMKSYRDKSGRLTLPDPHLHAHVFVINATHDATEGIWKAGEFMRLKRDATYYQAAYHTRLAEELQRLGYPIEPTANAFEIAGVPRSIIEAFSRRTKEVEEAAKRLGIFDDETKDGLGALTRRGKVPEFGMAQLRPIWRGLLTPSTLGNLDGIARAAQAVIAPRSIDDRTMADAGIRFALDHELERVSTVSERRLMARALNRTVGHTGVDTVRATLRAKPDLIFGDYEGERLVTTPEILAEESALFQMVRGGRGQCLPLVMGRYQFSDPLYLSGGKGSKEQRVAVEHLLHSPDWIMGLIGRAGTGKTTLLKEFSAAMKTTGHKLLLCAPTAEAARGVLRGEGFAEAETVKRLLTDPRLHAQMRNAVLWVDEAGMLGNRDTLALLDLAKRLGAARVILAGDVRQIRSVPRGDALLYLQDRAGLSVAHLNTIHRQKTPELKAAVEAMSRGDAADAFARLEKAQCVRETNVADAAKELAQAYADKITQRGARGEKKSALVVSPTHTEGERITTAIRAELKAREVIGKEETVMQRTVNLSWTKPQRENAASYEPGLVVQFKRNAPGFRKSERVRVVDVDARKGLVSLKTNRGKSAMLPLKHADAFQVYAVREMPVAVGECLKITENGTDKSGRHRLNNGDLVRVSGLAPGGGVILENGSELPRDFGHLTHGYVITADTAQAKTVDAVYLAISGESLGATDMRRFYVMLSRAREEAHIFTDDKEGVLRAALRDTVRVSATDLVETKRRSAKLAQRLHLEALERQRLLSRDEPEPTRRRVESMRHEPLEINL